MCLMWSMCSFQVGVFDDYGSKEFRAFLEVADSMVEQYAFRHTSGVPPPELPGGAPGPGSLPFVRVLKDYDEGYSDTQVSTMTPL